MDEAPERAVSHPLIAEHGSVPAGAGRTGGADTDAVDGAERALHPRVVPVWRMVSGLAVVLLVLPPLLLALVFTPTVAIVLLGPALALLVVATAWYPRARYRVWRWRLGPLALELRRGVIVRQHQAVPYFRIQQIDITQGPLERWLDLATLQVTTASASGSASLPGIAAGEAPKIRTELLRRAATAVGEHLDEVSDAV